MSLATNATQFEKNHQTVVNEVNTSTVNVFATTHLDSQPENTHEVCKVVSHPTGQSVQDIQGSISQAALAAKNELWTKLRAQGLIE